MMTIRMEVMGIFMPEHGVNIPTHTPHTMIVLILMPMIVQEEELSEAKPLR